MDGCGIHIFQEQLCEFLKLVCRPFQKNLLNDTNTKHEEELSAGRTLYTVDK